MLKRCRGLIWKHPRKGHLFAVACCQRIWPLLTDRRSSAAIETAALFAEGQASPEQLAVASKSAEDAHRDAFDRKGKVGASAEWSAQFAASSDPWFAASRASNLAFVAAGDGLWEGPEHAAQSDLIRCIFGPLPFRSVEIEPSLLTWKDGAVANAAHSIYHDRDFDKLPQLASILQDAGCHDMDVINHCRSSGPHVRGCWILLLLGHS
jgi:hypothetical protein